MDFDEIFDSLFGDGEEEEEGTHPTWRVTVRGSKVQLTGWAPWLAAEGPTRKLFQGRAKAGVAIADLTVGGEDGGELMVRFHSSGRNREQAEEVLLDWARRTGYRRVWLADRLVTLDGAASEVGVAEVKCPTCGERWRDGTPDFWLTVKQAGTFPRWCYLCGSELPQWKVSSAYRTHCPPAKRGDRTGQWQKDHDRKDSRRS
jgi:hypothetical protein